MSQALWQESAVEVAAGIRDRRFSCSEVMASVVERIRKLNPKLNAIVVDLADQALAEASAADRKLPTLAEPGPLFGVPVTIKVNVDQEGQATTNGLPAYRQSDRPRRRTAGAQPSPRRRHHCRPHQHARNFHACHHGKSVARAHLQSVASGRISRWIFGWRRGRRRRGIRRHPSRQRHRRFATVPGIRQRCSDHQADTGSHSRLQSVGKRGARAARAA